MIERQRLRNIKRNIGRVARRVELPKSAHDGTISLVCYGPSLCDTWKEIDCSTTIVSASKAHDFLRERGIVPDIHIEFDPRPHKIRHVTKPEKRTRYYLASCVHPDLVNALWQCDPILWHAHQTDIETNYIKQREPDAYFVVGGSSVGLRALELFYAEGYRRFEIFGMDSSFDQDGNRWAGKHFGHNQGDQITVFQGGRKFYTSIAFFLYAEQFLTCRRRLADAQINLHGQGLLQMMAETKELAA